MPADYLSDYLSDGPHYVSAQLVQDLLGMQEKGGRTKLSFQERNRLRIEVNVILKDRIPIQWNKDPDFLESAFLIC